MPIIKIITEIKAPVEEVFDLKRNIDLHASSLSNTKEVAVAGVTSGLIGFSQEVTLRAKHFGIWQQITSKITIFERPTRFRDTMIAGPFKRFDHDHLFEMHGEVTIMTDIFDYTTPFGQVGYLADVLFLSSYMKRLLEGRSRFIKQIAESEQSRCS